MERYKDSKQYGVALEVHSLLRDVDDMVKFDISHDSARDAWLEAQDLTTEQMMRKALNLLADKLAHKIKWREQQNKLDNDE